LLILDEPTAVLTPQEVDEFFQILRKMAQEKQLIIFISHKLHEVLAISDRVTILRDGRSVGQRENKNLTKAELAQMMVGRPVVLQYERAAPSVGDVKLKIVDVWVRNDWGEDQVKGVSLEIRSGEILGLAGVSGNGQRELAEALAGLRKCFKGRIIIDSIEMTKASPYERILAGQSYTPKSAIKKEYSGI
jgi:simple sugar transport system ATP-binding protein